MSSDEKELILQALCGIGAIVFLTLAVRSCELKPTAGGPMDTPPRPPEEAWPKDSDAAQTADDLTRITDMQGLRAN